MRRRRRGHPCTLPPPMHVFWIDRGTSNDSVPFFIFYCCPTRMTRRRRQGCPRTPPPPTCVILSAAARPMTASFFLFYCYPLTRTRRRGCPCTRCPLCVYGSVTFLFYWYCGPTTTMRRLARTTTQRGDCPRTPPPLTRVVLLSATHCIIVQSAANDSVLFYFLLLPIDNNGDDWGKVILVPRRPCCAYDSVTFYFNWYCDPTTTTRRLARLHSYPTAPVDSMRFFLLLPEDNSEEEARFCMSCIVFIATNWRWQGGVWAPSRANMSIAGHPPFSLTQFFE